MKKWKKTLSLLLAVLLFAGLGCSSLAETSAQLNSSIVTAIEKLDLPDAWKLELMMAAEMGFPMDKISKKQLSGQQLAALLDRFVELEAPDRLDEWKSLYKKIRRVPGTLSRFNTMAYWYLASQFVGGDYLGHLQDVSFAMSINHSWDVNYINMELFGGFDAFGQEFDGGFFGLSYLDAACYYYNLGRPSNFSGEYAFPLTEDNSFPAFEPPTYAEGVLAVIRLMSTARPSLGKDALMESFAADTQKVELNDTLQQVYDLGIAEMGILANAQKECPSFVAASMIGNVHKLRFGTESKAISAAGSAKAVTRYAFSELLYRSALLGSLGTDFNSIAQMAAANLENQINERADSEAFWSRFWPDSYAMGIHPTLGTPENLGAFECTDFQAFDFNLYRNPYYVDYALRCYDRRDGKKVLSVDENQNFRPDEVMTVEQVAQAALRYYYSFEAPAQMIAYEDTLPFDSSIITPKLLAKDSTLPDASCEHLPSEWHGVLMFDMGRAPACCLDRTPDKHIYEYEVQTVKDAGYNFVGLAFDFSLLQGRDPEKGKLNETRLKELDQAIAWFIERDIHVDLRCSGVGGMAIDTPFNQWVQWNHDAVQTADYAPEFAALWKALAKRYEGIPNRYLSFNLQIETEIGSEKQYAAFFTPVVEAIREADPDRCIIADIHSGGLTGESMAELGVALSYHTYDPRAFCALTEENQNDTAYLSTVQWPFTASDGITYDAEAVLNSSLQNGVSANELAATAEEYGVGFMVGEWGIFGNGLSSYRYPDETIEAYLMDMAEALEEKGYGWAYGNCHSTYSVSSHMPAVLNGDYVQVEDHMLYIEQHMMNWFQQINGVQ